MVHSFEGKRNADLIMRRNMYHSSRSSFFDSVTSFGDDSGSACRFNHFGYGGRENGFANWEILEKWLKNGGAMGFGGFCCLK